METWHKQILRRNRTNIIENIAKPDDVSDKLFEKQIFTESMRQDVEACKTDIEKSRNILDILPRRGPNAFNIFITVLHDTGNQPAADILLSGDPNTGARTTSQNAGAGNVGIAIQTRSTELPEKWPNDQAMTEEIRVRPCDLQSDHVRYKWLSQDVYSMKKRLRGRCLVISNQVFYGPLVKDKNGIQRCMLQDRYGTEQDVSALKTLFTQLMFEVEIHRDKTAAEMLTILEKEAGYPSHAQSDCFICVICSHGAREGIYGVDGGIVRLDGVTTCFDGDNCLALVNKPKLFFFQACQGETSDVGVPVDSLDGSPDLSDLVRNMTLENRADAEKETSVPSAQPRNVPAKLDMLVASATHPGYVSLRNVHYGSWFIQALVYVFQRFACEKHVLDLLTLVNRLVSRGRTPLDGSGDSREGQIMQAAMFHSSMQRDFFFFPGIVES